MTEQGTVFIPKCSVVRLLLKLTVVLIQILSHGCKMKYLEVIGVRLLPVLTNAVGRTKIFQIVPTLPAKCHH